MLIEDLSGKIVASLPISSFEMSPARIDTDLQPGVYLVTFKTTDSIQSSRFVVVSN